MRIIRGCLTCVNLAQKIKLKLKLDRKRYIIANITGRNVSILEIGVYKGDLASRMITAANEVFYVGIDLFTKMPSEFLKEESSPIPDTLDEVESKLKRLGKGKVKLLQGFSSELLPKVRDKFDYIIIDGGHAFETVKRDFELSIDLLNPSGEIILDDWTNNYGVRKGYGIRQLTKLLSHSGKYEVKVLKNPDFFVKPDGILITRLVTIKKKN